nr:MAG TPA_asm: hypothetical protein [Caudoviricetes sp.]
MTAIPGRTPGIVTAASGKVSFRQTAPATI